MIFFALNLQLLCRPIIFRQYGLVEGVARWVEAINKLQLNVTQEEVIKFSL